MVKGRKRWVLRPPEAGTAKNGHGGSDPPGVMRGDPEAKGRRCVVRNKPADALHCDQLEGDTIWVPHYWWHETCGLDEYSIGLGGLSHDDCCPHDGAEREGFCDLPEVPGVTGLATDAMKAIMASASDDEIKALWQRWRQLGVEEGDNAAIDADLACRISDVYIVTAILYALQVTDPAS